MLKKDKKNMKVNTAFSILPSTKEKLKKIADKHNISSSNLLQQILDNFFFNLENNKEKTEN